MPLPTDPGDFTAKDVDRAVRSLFRRYWTCIHGLDVREDCQMCEAQLQADLKQRLEAQKRAENGE